jgi:hypothetical protein
MSLVRICVWMLVLFVLTSNARAQDWSISVSSQPPAHAVVGDVVPVTVRVSVDAGADDLAINSVHSGATTTGLTGLTILSQPTFVAAGTTGDVTITMRVVAPPGTTGVHLAVDVDGTYGAFNGIRSAASNSIAVLEGVGATLSGGPPQVYRGDQIAFDLTLVGNSDSDAQIAVPAAGYAVPVGTTLVMRTRGSAVLPARTAVDFRLVVAVSDFNEDGTAIVMTPTGVTYAMSQIGLFNCAVTTTPPSVTSVVVVPLFMDGFE